MVGSAEHAHVRSDRARLVEGLTGASPRRQCGQKPPRRATTDDVRAFLLHLRQQRKLSARTANVAIAALRFLFAVPEPTLEALRTFWKAQRVTGTVLFPGRDKRKPLTREAVHVALRAAARVVLSSDAARLG